MTIQEMGPGKVKVRVTVQAEVIIDEDDLGPVKAQGWDDTLRHLHQEGIPIRKRVEQLEPKPEPVKKSKKKAVAVA